MTLTYLRMDSSEEERHVSPNASHGNYIAVHTGSTYREKTVTVRSDLKSRDQKRKTDIAMTRRWLVLSIEMTG